MQLQRGIARGSDRADEGDGDAPAAIDLQWRQLRALVLLRGEEAILRRLPDIDPQDVAHTETVVEGAWGAHAESSVHAGLFESRQCPDHILIQPDNRISFPCFIARATRLFQNTDRTRPFAGEHRTAAAR